MQGNLSGAAPPMRHGVDRGPARRHLLERWSLVILLTMTTVALAEAKAHLSELVARVGGQHERVVVTVHGRPSAVLLAVEDLEALEETIAVLSDPVAMRALAASEADFAAGRVESMDDVTAALEQQHLDRTA